MEQDKKSEIAKKEEEVLKFWQENKIFEKTLEKRDKNGGFLKRKRRDYVFYDGPPFATGTPHYGHLLAGTMKDVIPRFKTMQGYRVPRKWGWDCHGLPIENIVEKKLGLKNKNDIENYGIAAFNEEARKNVMLYASDWKRMVPRMGRFVDMEHDYKTMDSSYTESVWRVFKTLYDKGLIYEGFKSMHLCPHCGTTLSNFEVAQGYKDINDISVTAKFELVDEPGTYLLAWTTTPWTLPGNVALAINPKIEYSILENTTSLQRGISKGEIFLESGKYVVASIAVPRLLSLMEQNNFTKETKIKGSKFIGKFYKPLFDYYAKDRNLKNHENGWKVYGADFVTTEDGTGIVHIAPAFGEDDLKLGENEKLPFVQHVGRDGRFKNEVSDFAGLLVKPKDDPKETDEKVTEFLEKKGLIFSKKNFTHSYSHCWRCETPLLNYASESWFVAVSKIKEKLIKTNKKINWVPHEMRDGRFGKILETAPDWAISRSRFWGAPIPIWKCKECAEVKAAGSLEEIARSTRNEFIAIRHGQAENNILRVTSGRAEAPHHLTELGRKEVFEAVKILRSEKIDMIFYSPFIRTRESAEILAKELGIPSELVVEDNRLREVFHGSWENKSIDEYRSSVYKDWDLARFTESMDGVESYNSVRQRMGDFLFDIDKKYSGKKILVVSHDVPIWMMLSASEGVSASEAVKRRGDGDVAVKNAEWREVVPKYIPRNENYELDFHRPYIDEVKLECSCGGEMRRVTELFDCWFESGSMPYGQWHYPFENLENFEPKKGRGFPASFIGEGLDQTRGWFYSMLVLSVALFGKPSYKNVITNGIILSENGQKMSKRLKNYPDPLDIINKYGADALRYYLLSSPAVRAEEMRFSEKGVDEVVKKIITRLNNVYSFYEMYSSSQDKNNKTRVSSNILDLWILARLNQIVVEITEAMENYELDKAARPLGDFVEDLSVWYIRRSRERFKGDDWKDKNNALATTHFVLAEFSKLLAPFMPFMAESVYQRLKLANLQMDANNTNNNTNKESVHLEDWPKTKRLTFNTRRLIFEMKEVRRIVSLGLEARAKAGIKVRQPLNELRIKNCELGIKRKGDFLNLAKDEVNIKKILFDGRIEGEVKLDTEITPELKEEGEVREFVRAVQEFRKKSGLTIQDLVLLNIETSEKGKIFIESHKKKISKAALLKDVSFQNVQNGEEIAVEDLVFKICFEKQARVVF